MAFRALEAALGAVWAMEPTALETLLTIAAREHEITPEALEAYQAKALAKAEQATVRDGVAIIAANGPLMKRGNIMTAMSGATSYDIMRRDLQTALDDPKVKAILFNIDSPGGEASGTAALAAAIYAARDVKPIKAFVNGDGASAAYWIASAASEIIVDPTAILGSIGVQMAMRSRDDPKGTTTYRFVSSQSPMKNADPGSDAGAEQLQGFVDAMGAVFVEAVASYRGVDTETVLSNFGKGGIFVGKDAVAAGLADRVGNFEGVLAELSAPRRSARAKGAKMTEETTFSAAERDAAVASARAAEKTRVASLRTVAAGFGANDADLTAAIDGDMTVEAFSLAQSAKAADARTAAAVAREAEAATAEAARLAALKTDEEAAAKAGGAPSGDDTNEADAMIAGITAFIPANRRASAK